MPGRFLNRKEFENNLKFLWNQNAREQISERSG